MLHSHKVLHGCKGVRLAVGTVFEELVVGAVVATVVGTVTVVVACMYVEGQ